MTVTLPAVEDLLRRSAEWLTSRERTGKDLEDFLADVLEKTGVEVELVHSAMGIVRNLKGDVLLLRRNANDRSYPGAYSFPGGRVDPEDADSAAAVLRETLQETGLTVEIQNFHSTRYTTIAERQRIYQVDVYCFVPIDESTIVLSDEHDAFVWGQPLEIIQKVEDIPLSGSIITDLLQELTGVKWRKTPPIG